MWKFHCCWLQSALRHGMSPAVCSVSWPNLLPHAVTNLACCMAWVCSVQQVPVHFSSPSSRPGLLIYYTTLLRSLLIGSKNIGVSWVLSVKIPSSSHTFRVIHEVKVKILESTATIKVHKVSWIAECFQSSNCGLNSVHLPSLFHLLWISLYVPSLIKIYSCMLCASDLLSCYVLLP